MAVIIDNRSDISGIGKLSDVGVSWDWAEKQLQRVGLMKKPKAPTAPAQATTVSAPVAPPYVPTWKDKVAEQWSKPVVKAGVGVAGLLAAVLAYKKWKK